MSDRGFLTRDRSVWGVIAFFGIMLFVCLMGAWWVVRAQSSGEAEQIRAELSELQVPKSGNRAPIEVVEGECGAGDAISLRTGTRLERSTASAVEIAESLSSQLEQSMWMKVGSDEGDGLMLQYLSPEGGLRLRVILSTEETATNVALTLIGSAPSCY